jgi:hypothetical protein
VIAFYNNLKQRGHYMSSSISEQKKRSLSDGVLDAAWMYETEDGGLMVPCVRHNIDIAVGTTSICECVLGGAPVEVIAYCYAKNCGVYIAYVGCRQVAHRAAELSSACPMCLGEILADHPKACTKAAIENWERFEREGDWEGQGKLFDFPEAS